MRRRVRALMIPSEHREKALGLLERAAEHTAHSAARLAFLAEAQVHATLSLREAPEPAVVTVQAPDLSEAEVVALREEIRTGTRPTVLALRPEFDVDAFPGVLRIRKIPAAVGPVAATVARAEEAVDEALADPEPEKKPAPKKRAPRKTAPKKESTKDEA